MTRIVNVYKAQPSGYDGSVDAIEIHVDIDMPVDPPDDYAQRDADLITNVLYSTLPGATIDALLAAMLTRRGTQLRVQLPAAQPDQTET